MSNIFGIRNDERFVYSKKIHKKFKNKMSPEAFKKAFEDRGLGGVKSSVIWIDPELPTHEPRQEYSEKLKNILIRIEKEEKIKYRGWIACYVLGMPELQTTQNNKDITWYSGISRY